VHTTVLLSETLDLLEPGAGEVFVDATAGTGGCTRALADRVGESGRVIALDWDAQAVAVLRELVGDRPQVVVWLENYANLDKVLEAEGVRCVDGAVIDCGLSSLQLADAERGFSVTAEGGLSMRMSALVEGSAAEIVNSWSREDLEDLFRRVGQEGHARRIAGAIVEERQRGPIASARQLAQIVERVVPHRGRIHQASRVFMSIRKYVNREDENLAVGMRKAFAAMSVGARLAVLTYESGEARVVKAFCREMVLRGLGAMVTKKAVSPTWAERRANPRSRSARLRVLEKISETGT